ALWGKALSLRNELLSFQEKNPPLLTGKDLIGLGLSPGPSFRVLLSELRDEQMEGRIKTRDAALHWVEKRAKSV
ncbi:MAG: hypothetical protein AB1585_19025, partial [Thermodesulfobacteriota bacterium]